MRAACFLRGINVGRSVRLPMADLRSIATSCGFRDPRTHLQSGNLVIEVPDERFTGDDTATDDVAHALEAAIAEATVLTPAVLVRTEAEVHDVIAANPFGHSGQADAPDPTTLHVTLARAPFDDLGLDPAGFAPEEWAMVGRELYLCLPNGMGRSRLAEALDKAHRRTARVVTTRNWRTVLAVAAMLD